MALYPDYAPKKGKFRLTDIPPQPEAAGEKAAPPEEQQPLCCVRCPGVKLQAIAGSDLRSEEIKAVARKLLEERK